MHNQRWCEFWGRFLPAGARRELFEPACQDLRASDASCHRRRLPFALRALGLLAESWRVFLFGAFSLPKEPFPVFLKDLRQAVRLMFREPGFTLATVLTLALGVGVNVAVFALVEAVLLRPLPYTAGDRLTVIRHRDQRTGITKDFIPIGDYIDLVHRQTTFDAFASYDTFESTVSGLGEPFRAHALAGSSALLETLGVQPALGRAFQPADSRPGAAPVILVAHEFWRDHLGSDPAILGRGIKAGKTERQVIGVLPPGFSFPPDSHVDFVFPATVPPSAPAERRSRWTFAIARLKSSTTVQQAAAQLGTVSRQLEREFPASNRGSEYYPVPLRDALVGNTGRALVLMLAAATLVLLIASANVANLMMARSLARGREMGVRMALGAGYARLLAQLLTESVVLAAVAGSVGILIGLWMTQALVTLIPKSLNVPGLSAVHINLSVLGFALAITSGTAVVCALTSAFTVRTGSGSGTLISPTRVTSGAKARKSAAALVVTEVALALVLLIGAGLILRTLSGLLSVDPGFQTEHVLSTTVQFPADRYRDAGALRTLYGRGFAALKGVQEIRAVGVAAVTPLTGNNWTIGFQRADQPMAAGERPPEVGWQLASGGYFETLQIPLRSGRLFDERDMTGRPVVIISESIERRYFPNQPPVGREVLLGDKRAEIVGVVGDIRRSDLRDGPRADMYVSFENAPVNQITFFVRTSGEPTVVTSAVQSALRAIEPGLVILQTRSMRDIAADSFRVTQLLLWLLGVFAATALSLSAVGIYGVMAYMVRQRMREIGTRIALGASRRDILWLVMKRGAMIAVLGSGIGAGIALVVTRWLGSMLYGVSASDPVTLLLAITVLTVTALAACYLPARRAAAIDPAKTLAES